MPTKIGKFNVIPQYVTIQWREITAPISTANSRYGGDEAQRNPLTLPKTFQNPTRFHLKHVLLEPLVVSSLLTSVQPNMLHPNSYPLTQKWRPVEHQKFSKRLSCSQKNLNLGKVYKYTRKGREKRTGEATYIYIGIHILKNIIKRGQK